MENLPAWANPRDHIAALRSGLDTAGVKAELIYSVDETAGMGLVDLLPPGAGKRAAIEHLQQTQGIANSDLLFAGDSGNDLDALVAPYPSVLVANASQAVRSEALSRAAEAGTLDTLYLATGTTGHGNGNYSAGILEAVAHFWPEGGTEQK